MKIDYNRDELTIMGVRFRTEKEFEGALYSITSNVYEGWKPTEADVKKLRNYIIRKYKEPIYV